MEKSKTGVEASEKKVKGKNKIAPFWLVATAIIAPCAYLIGIGFYEGYMEAFGIDPDSFPAPTPTIYVFSYQVVGYVWLSLGELVTNTLDFLFKSHGIYFFIIAVVIAILSVYYFLCDKDKGSDAQLKAILITLKKHLPWSHWKNSNFAKAVVIVLIPPYVLFYAMICIIAIVALWWFVPLSAKMKGYEEGQKKIELYYEKGCHAGKKTGWNMCATIVDDKGNTLYEGILVAMNGKTIAFFNKEGSYISMLQDGFSVRRKRHEELSSQKPE